MILLHTHRHLSALSEVVDLDVVVLLVFASGRFRFTETPLAMDFTVRVPGLVAVGADATTGIFLFGALWNANALGFATLRLANLSSSAVDLRARVQAVQAHYLLDVFEFVLLFQGLKRKGGLVGKN